MIFYNNLILPARESFKEIGRLFPDSILFGSLLLYLITQHLPYAVLSIFFIETSLLYRLLSFLLGKVFNVGTPTNSEAACRPGFQISRLEFERRTIDNSYPSLSAFYTGSTAAYLYGCLISYGDTLKTMGIDWEGRMAFSAIAIILSLGTFFLFQLGCTDWMSIGLGLLMGMGTGVCLYYVNSRVFGVEGVNFLGLPFMTDKTDTKNPLYVCVPNSVTGN